MSACAAPRVLVVTGTDTDVGKTVVTAAVVATLRAAGASVAAVKPVQTGVSPGGRGDLADVADLGGADAVHEGARLPLPMAPRAAAADAGRALPPVAEHARAVRELVAAGHHVVVEGSGGLLVELDDDRATLLDLALGPGVVLAEPGGRGAPVIVVARAGLGTLNHVALTLAALRGAGASILGTVIGSWPAQPSAIDLDNRRELASGTGPFAGAPLLGAIPTGAPTLTPAQFRAAAPTWLPGIESRLA